MPMLATDPPVSEAQRRAMYAAAAGRSTLGISPSVGKEYTEADPGGKLPKKAKDMSGPARSVFARLFKQWVAEELEESEHATDKAASQAAGIAFMTADGHALFLKRSDQGDHKGEWCFPGGTVEDGESKEQTAIREAKEETGQLAKTGAGGISELHRTISPDGVDFLTYAQPTEIMFSPNLNEEHTDYKWAPLDDPPQPLHPGVASTLSMLGEKAQDAIHLNLRGPYVSKKDAGPTDYTMSRSVKKGGKGPFATGSGLAGDTKDYRYDTMALDRDSARRYDSDGRLHVASSHISKSTVNPYFGREIPDYEKLGLVPDKKYMLLRDPEELKKAAATFNNLPVLNRHIPATSDQHPAEYVIGSTGTDASYNDPYLDNSLVFWPKEAIDNIEGGGPRELSCAYRYRADMTPGTYDGQQYDGVMRDIVGNHVALVKEGRAGSDVMVGDAAHGKGSRMGYSFAAFVPTRSPWAFDAFNEDAWSPEAREAAAKARAAKHGQLVEKHAASAYNHFGSGNRKAASAHKRAASLHEAARLTVGKPDYEKWQQKSAEATKAATAVGPFRSR